MSDMGPHDFVPRDENPRDCAWCGSHVTHRWHVIPRANEAIDILRDAPVGTRVEVQDVLGQTMFVVNHVMARLECPNVTRFEWTILDDSTVLFTVIS